MRDVASVCVYCASSLGAEPVFAAAAAEVGAALAVQGITVVYGGSAVGLMGVVADAALAAGGRVVGVIPGGLFDREVPHRALTELHEVASMHERKQLMVDLADGFVALPGGLGTLEELAEVATWAQLGIHHKPIAALNLEGYWDGLLAWLDRSVSAGFVSERNRRLITFVDRVEALLPVLRAVDVPPEPEWLDRSQI